MRRVEVVATSLVKTTMEMETAEHANTTETKQNTHQAKEGEIEK